MPIAIARPAAPPENPMPDRSHYAWPFLDDAHREQARALEQWAATRLADEHEPDVDAACRQLVADLGRDGWLRYCAGKAWGGAFDSIDTRSLCVARETLAWHSGLADFAFAMQGLGSGSISLAGTEAQQRRYLPDVVAGRKLAAFALSEPDAGSDVAALSATATRDGAHWVLDGCKTWISNAGIADFYCVFARTGEAPGSRGISAFVVDAATPGLEVSDRIPVMAPHPLGTLRFSGCRVPADALLGAPGEGFKIAMRNLDIFRTSVAAAALGFARRALDEALGRATRRRMLGQMLADFQLTQAALADMATGIDAAALLTYRAAWVRDRLGERGTREVAMAKMVATETAQQVIDKAVQLFGGLGVKSGMAVELLYREIRPLRIYEGATEVQKLIIGRELLRQFEPPKSGG
jgi:acyl-CoA dehydrogenase